MRAPLLLSLVVLTLSGSSGNGEPHPAIEQGEQILFLGAVPRLFLLKVYVDGGTWEEHISGEIHRQFRLLDVDDDQQLSESEVEGVRNLAGAARLPLTRAQLVTFDQDGNGIFDIAEFDRLVRTHITQPFVLTSDASTSRQLHLFHKIDRDDNHRLSRDEVNDAVTALRRLDFDEDLAVGLDELQPFRNPLLAGRRLTRSAGGGEVPFLVTTDWTADTWARQLLDRYGTERPELTVESIASLWPATSSHDKDGDAVLNHDELMAACRDIAPMAIVRVDLPLTGRVRPQANIAWHDQSLPTTRRRLPTSVLRWRLDSVPIEVKAQASDLLFADVRSYYLQRFQIADADDDDRLDGAEYTALDLGAIDFSLVDFNSDQYVSQDELRIVLDRATVGLRTQLVVSVRPDGESLFLRADRNGDRRLTERELLDLPARLNALDQNGDGYWDSSEFSQQYRLTVSLGTPPLFLDTEQNRPRDANQPIVMPSNTGPSWFQHMDRNRDGDLSWNEFLGTREQFEKLDRDGDELIAVGELEAE